MTQWMKTAPTKIACKLTFDTVGKRNILRINRHWMNELNGRKQEVEMELLEIFRNVGFIFDLNV